ncbi:MAG TPA: VanZ family protein [Flavisolibacter sp.]|jgi:VanZ family protein|nr:VanZ family protein [Flavisolibacter sp.]
MFLHVDPIVGYRALKKAHFYLACSMLKAHWLRSKWLAVSWFLIMNVLFFLPGSALPGQGWFGDFPIDKLVHIGLFAGLVFIGASAFRIDLNQYKFIVLVLVIAYGLAIEVIQREWIANRSFDLYDLLCDTIGGIGGGLAWLGTYRKK